MRAGQPAPSPVRRGPLAQGRYRARQFWNANHATVNPEERAALLSAAEVPPALAALFCGLPAPYQRHALAVARLVQAHGPADPPLLAAALLHDIGKWDPRSGRRVTLLTRLGSVLLAPLPGGPALVRRISRRPPTSQHWRYPWYLQAHHPALGAALAARAGAPAAVVELIRYHADPAPPLAPVQRARLVRLQAADEES